VETLISTNSTNIKLTVYREGDHDQRADDKQLKDGGTFAVDVNQCHFHHCSLYGSCVVRSDQLTVTSRDTNWTCRSLAFTRRCVRPLPGPGAAAVSPHEYLTALRSLTPPLVTASILLNEKSPILNQVLISVRAHPLYGLASVTQ